MGLVCWICWAALGLDLVDWVASGAGLDQHLGLLILLLSYWAFITAGPDLLHNISLVCCNAELKRK